MFDFALTLHDFIKLFRRENFQGYNLLISHTFLTWVGDTCIKLKASRQRARKDEVVACLLDLFVGGAICDGNCSSKNFVRWLVA